MVDWDLVLLYFGIVLILLSFLPILAKRYRKQLGLGVHFSRSLEFWTVILMTFGAIAIMPQACIWLDRVPWRTVISSIF